MLVAIALAVLAGLVLVGGGLAVLERVAQRDDEVDRARRRSRARELDALEGPS